MWHHVPAFNSEHPITDKKKHWNPVTLCPLMMGWVDFSFKCQDLNSRICHQCLFMDFLVKYWRILYALHGFVHGVAILESRWKVSVESYIQYIYLTHNLPLQLTGFTQLNWHNDSKKRRRGRKQEERWRLAEWMGDMQYSTSVRFCCGPMHARIRHLSQWKTLGKCWVTV